MSQFLRMIDHSIIDFFVQQAEDSCYCRDQLLKDSPYLLGYGELYSLSGDIPEEASYYLVVAEAFCNGKDVVLYAAQCRGSYLGCEACTLAFAESEIGLAVHEHDFKRPALGVDLPRLNEIQSGISGEQSVPFAVLCPAYKKNSDGYASKNSIVYHIVALAFAAVLKHFQNLFFSAWPAPVPLY